MKAMVGIGILAVFFAIYYFGFVKPAEIRRQCEALARNSQLGQEIRCAQMAELEATMGLPRSSDQCMSRAQQTYRTYVANCVRNRG